MDLPITYSERPNKPTLTFTGVYGGPAPDGSAIVAHLFVEFGTVPIAVKHEVEGQRILKPDVEVLKRSELTREIQGTIVMSPQAALMLSRFLKEKAELLIGKNT